MGLSRISDMKLVKSGKSSLGKIDVYDKHWDTLHYKGIEFNSIEYGFSKDESIFVAYKATGPDNQAAYKIKR